MPRSFGQNSEISAIVDSHLHQSDVFTHLPTICQIRLILSQIILFFETFDNQNKMDQNIFSIQQEFNAFGQFKELVQTGGKKDEKVGLKKKSS